MSSTEEIAVLTQIYYGNLEKAGRRKYVVPGIGVVKLTRGNEVIIIKAEDDTSHKGGKK